MVELLAPSGEYESFLGAINAGADAVYLAGNMYGARASAVNFTQKEIIDAVNYAHLLGRKVYLTVNTLTKDEELENLYDFLKPLYLSGLDAVIVQDIGVFLYIKEAFPSLDIHVSTQAFVTSTEGALYYKSLGAERVVLARELTLPEVREISSLDIETECFVHGAMCYSYSGMCLFSSFLGGNSGNRGRCKGPCRQPYVFDGKEDYILSLKDMSTVDMIDKLIDSKITSFKIEGRLKSPAYAAGVTAIYRKYIDKYLSDPNKELIVSDEDRILLNNLYSRSGSLHGYYDYTSSAKMITFEKGSYSKVDNDAEKEIIEKYVRNPKKIALKQHFEALPGTNPVLKGSFSVNNKDYDFEVTNDFVCEKAIKAVNSDDYVKHLAKLGDTPFYPDKTECVIDNTFIPAGVLNSMRRYLTEGLIDKFNNENYRLDDSSKPSVSRSFDKDSLNYIRGFVDDINQFEVLSESDFVDSIVVPISLCYESKFECLCDATNKEIYIETPAVFRKQNVADFDKAAEFSRKNHNVKGFYVNQFDSYSYLNQICPDMKFGADVNLYAYNSISAKFLDDIFDFVCAPLELKEKDIYGLNNNGFEIMMYGRYPLMQTANCILKSRKSCRKYTDNKDSLYEYIKDRTNAVFPVRTRCFDNLCLNTVYNSKPTSLHKYYENLRKRGYNAFSFRFTDESAEETAKLLHFYEDLFEGKEVNAYFEYTNGHMKSGIL